MDNRDDVTRALDGANAPISDDGFLSLGIEVEVDFWPS